MTAFQARSVSFESFKDLTLKTEETFVIGLLREPVNVFDFCFGSKDFFSDFVKCVFKLFVFGVEFGRFVLGICSSAGRTNKPLSSFLI